MIRIAHNIERPYTFEGFTCQTVTKAELAGILGTLAKHHGSAIQAPNTNPNITAYIFKDGITVNVVHTENP